MMKGRLELLDEEEVLSRFRPHPLSVIHGWYVGASLWVSALVLHLASSSGAWTGLEGHMARLGVGDLPLYVYVVLATVATWKVLGLLHRGSWRRPWLFYVPMLAVWALLVSHSGRPAVGLTCQYLAASGVAAAMLSELERRSYSYTITSTRIVLRRQLLSRSERQVRLESVVDLLLDQGVVGRLLGFGNIIPVTASQLGTEEDGRQLAAAGALKGPGGRASLVLGTARDRRWRVSSGMATQVLVGVPAPANTMELLSVLMNDRSASAELRRIRGILEGGTSPGDAGDALRVAAAAGHGGEG